MEFPKLKLPPKNHSVFDAAFAERKDGTFANRLRSVMNTYQEQHEASYHYKSGDSQSQKTEKMCAGINEYYKDMRFRIDQEMQAFLLEHDGTIDSWSNSVGQIVSSSPDVKDSRFMFDYFGEDYKVSLLGKIVRKSSKLVYRNTYRFPGTEAYHEAEEKKERLESEVKRAKSADGRFVQLLCAIGGLYLLISILSILGDMIFHTGILDPLFEKNTTLGIILGFPYAIYAIIVKIFGGPTDKAVILSSILLLGVCLFGMLYCFSDFRTYSENVKALKKAKKERDALVKSKEYKQIVAENDSLRRLNEDLAEEWHRAWYQWVCGIKDEAADGNQAEVPGKD